ncbi:MAG: LysR family transcriptional regulator [Pseudomonadota bacterium]
MSDFDWNQMRAFLATAETGSFSAAARALGLTQPSISRQVAALEARLGVTLFQRIGKSLVISETGLALLDDARAMGGAADRLALVSTGRSDAVEGLVSISANEAVAVHLLPPILVDLRRKAPELRIEVICSSALSDLRRGEADIAIRHVRPEEPELVGKWLRDAQAAFYASQEWVLENGVPATSDTRNVSFIGFDRTDQFTDRLEAMGFKSGGLSFPFLTEDGNANWALVKAGLGVGVAMIEVGDAEPGMVRIFKDLPTVEFPIWLVAHSELRTSRRIRFVFDALAEGLSEWGHQGPSESSLSFPRSRNVNG